jgi:hypothetical protein
MILTPEQQAGWEAELAEYNAGITRSNQSITEHNAMLPPEVEPVPLRDLLTLDQYIQLKLDEVARAGANKARSEAKTNLQLLTERDAMAVQLAAVEADKLIIEAARVQLVSDLAAKTTAYDAEVVKVTALTAEKATLLLKQSALTSDKESLTTQLAAANETIAGLQARIVELTPPEQPTSITKYQATKWLRDSNLYDTVMTMLESNQDANDRWFWGGDLMRNDPIVEALGQQLGLDTEALDDAFAAASQIQ